MKLFILLLTSLLVVLQADECNVSNTDMWWGDISNFFARDFQDCKDRCRVTSACRAVVYYYTGINVRKCFLKNGSHGSRGHCSWCQAAFKPCITNEGPCPAGQYKTSRTSCGSCSANSYSASGSTSCSTCPAGTYSNAAASNCINCPAGKYRPSGAAGSCSACAANTFNAQVGQSTCSACAAGHYSNSGASSCTACPAGQYRSPTASGGCTACSANTFSAQVGQSSCSHCKAGSYSNGGASSCISCPAGQFRAAGVAGGCIICPANSFSDKEGQSSCTKCEEHYISPAGAASADACVMTNGDHCFVLSPAIRLIGQYGDEPLALDDAKDACFAEKQCTGIVCHKKKTDYCYRTTGQDNVKATGRKWHSYVKAKDCY